MQNQTLILFITVSTVVLAVIAFGGLLVLLHIKKNLVKRILLERCIKEGVRFIIEPGAGFRTESEDFSFFRKKRGIVCLTEYELIFIPFIGSTIIKLPIQDIDKHIQLENEPGVWVVYTRDNGVFRISGA